MSRRSLLFDNVNECWIFLVIDRGVFEKSHDNPILCTQMFVPTVTNVKRKSIAFPSPVEVHIEEIMRSDSTAKEVPELISIMTKKSHSQSRSTKSPSEDREK